ncbi:hypothetical protein SARC_10576 [Sphaeroforma arctica JP610]|uniref:TMEM131 second Ig-like domain-containing protein n=1 Tax=Sphaeroforma arctica JP610 TaxID=667725 RepID=A0A0L0FLQ2_9EUKA|nr:hypothetical protein SARC_10576 [Sphaeroforma arctica JP610]KNC76948.1 hypothetical protein SARC_10576 [Sphaeroforma arctica JP610]|eukprot:XP_014150850.1 hypothetical protein SARC_10576 [Sphaeroforma arctica JP610]
MGFKGGRPSPVASEHRRTTGQVRHNMNHPNFVGKVAEASMYKLTPSSVNFGRIALCSPNVVFINLASSKAGLPITIHQIRTKDNQFQAIAEKEENSGQTLIRVMFLPKVFGYVEGQLLIRTNIGDITMKMQGVGIRSPYKVKPIRGWTMPLGVDVSGPAITLYNPHNTTLHVVESFTIGQGLELETNPSDLYKTHETWSVWSIHPYQWKEIAFMRVPLDMVGLHNGYVSLSLMRATDAVKGDQKSRSAMLGGDLEPPAAGEDDANTQEADSEYDGSDYDIEDDVHVFPEVDGWDDLGENDFYDSEDSADQPDWSLGDFDFLESDQGSEGLVGDDALQDANTDPDEVNADGTEDGSASDRTKNTKDQYRGGVKTFMKIPLLIPVEINVVASGMICIDRAIDFGTINGLNEPISRPIPIISTVVPATTVKNVYLNQAITGAHVWYKDTELHPDVVSVVGWLTVTPTTNGIFGGFVVVETDNGHNNTLRLEIPFYGRVVIGDLALQEHDSSVFIGGVDAPPQERLLAFKNDYKFPVAIYDVSLVRGPDTPNFMVSYKARGTVIGRGEVAVVAAVVYSRVADTPVQDVSTILNIYSNASIVTSVTLVGCTGRLIMAAAGNNTGYAVESTRSHRNNNVDDMQGKDSVEPSGGKKHDSYSLMLSRLVGAGRISNLKFNVSNYNVKSAEATVNLIHKGIGSIRLSVNSISNVDPYERADFNLQQVLSQVSRSPDSTSGTDTPMEERGLRTGDKIHIPPMHHVEFILSMDATKLVEGEAKGILKFIYTMGYMTAVHGKLQLPYSFTITPGSLDLPYTRFTTSGAADLPPELEKIGSQVIRIDEVYAGGMNSFPVTVYNNYTQKVGVTGVSLPPTIPFVKFRLNNAGEHMEPKSKHVIGYLDITPLQKFKYMVNAANFLTPALQEACFSDGVAAGDNAPGSRTNYEKEEGDGDYISDGVIVQRYTPSTQALCHAKIRAALELPLLEDCWQALIDMDWQWTNVLNKMKYEGWVDTFSYDTDVQINNTVDYTLRLTRPDPLPENLVTFLPIMIGSTTMKSIEIHNPVDTPIAVKLFTPQQVKDRAPELYNHILLLYPEMMAAIENFVHYIIKPPEDPNSDELTYQRLHAKSGSYYTGDTAAGGASENAGASDRQAEEDDWDNKFANQLVLGVRGRDTGLVKITFKPKFVCPMCEDRVADGDRVVYIDDQIQMGIYEATFRSRVPSFILVHNSLGALTILRLEGQVADGELSIPYQTTRSSSEMLFELPELDADVCASHLEAFNLEFGTSLGDETTGDILGAEDSKFRNMVEYHTPIGGVKGEKKVKRVLNMLPLARSVLLYNTGTVAMEVRQLRVVGRNSEAFSLSHSAVLKPPLDGDGTEKGEEGVDDAPTGGFFGIKGAAELWDNVRSGHGSRKTHIVMDKAKIKPRNPAEDVRDPGFQFGYDDVPQSMEVYKIIYPGESFAVDIIFHPSFANMSIESQLQIISRLVPPEAEAPTEAVSESAFMGLWPNGPNLGHTDHSFYLQLHGEISEKVYKSCSWLARETAAHRRIRIGEGDTVWQALLNMWEDTTDDWYFVRTVSLVAMPLVVLALVSVSQRDGSVAYLNGIANSVCTWLQHQRQEYDRLMSQCYPANSREGFSSDTSLTTNSTASSTSSASASSDEYESNDDLSMDSFTSDISEKGKGIESLSAASSSATGTEEQCSAVPSDSSGTHKQADTKSAPTTNFEALLKPVSITSFAQPKNDSPKTGSNTDQNVSTGGKKTKKGASNVASAQNNTSIKSKLSKASPPTPRVASSNSKPTPAVSGHNGKMKKKNSMPLLNTVPPDVASPQRNKTSNGIASGTATTSKGKPRRLSATLSKSDMNSAGLMDDGKKQDTGKANVSRSSSIRTTTGNGLSAENSSEGGATGHAPSEKSVSKAVSGPALMSGKDDKQREGAGGKQLNRDDTTDRAKLSNRDSGTGATLISPCRSPNPASAGVSWAKVVKPQIKAQQGSAASEPNLVAQRITPLTSPSLNAFNSAVSAGSLRNVFASVNNGAAPPESPTGGIASKYANRSQSSQLNETKEMGKRNSKNNRREKQAQFGSGALAGNNRGSTSNMYITGDESVGNRRVPHNTPTKVEADTSTMGGKRSASGGVRMNGKGWKDSHVDFERQSVHSAASSDNGYLTPEPSPLIAASGTASLTEANSENDRYRDTDYSSRMGSNQGPVGETSPLYDSIGSIPSGTIGEDLRAFGGGDEAGEFVDGVYVVGSTTSAQNLTHARTAVTPQIRTDEELDIKDERGGQGQPHHLQSHRSYQAPAPVHEYQFRSEPPNNQQYSSVDDHERIVRQRSQTHQQLQLQHQQHQRQHSYQYQYSNNAESMPAPENRAQTYQPTHTSPPIDEDAVLSRMESTTGLSYNNSHQQGDVPRYARASREGSYSGQLSQPINRDRSGWPTGFKNSENYRSAADNADGRLHQPLTDPSGISQTVGYDPAYANANVGSSYQQTRRSMQSPNQFVSAPNYAPAYRLQSSVTANSVSYGGLLANSDSGEVRRNGPVPAAIGGERRMSKRNQSDSSMFDNGNEVQAARIGTPGDRQGHQQQSTEHRQSTEQSDLNSFFSGYSLWNSNAFNTGLTTTPSQGSAMGFSSNMNNVLHEGTQLPLDMQSGSNSYSKTRLEFNRHHSYLPHATNSHSLVGSANVAVGRHTPPLTLTGHDGSSWLTSTDSAELRSGLSESNSLVPTQQFYGIAQSPHAPSAEDMQNSYSGLQTRFNEHRQLPFYGAQHLAEDASRTGSGLSLDQSISSSIGSVNKTSMTSVGSSGMKMAGNYLPSSRTGTVYSPQYDDTDQSPPDTVDDRNASDGSRRSSGDHQDVTFSYMSF